MVERKLLEAQMRARVLGIKGELMESTRKDQMLQHASYDLPSGSMGNGSILGCKCFSMLHAFRGHGTYLDHRDETIRAAWRVNASACFTHGKIMKEGKPAYKDPSSPEYYSWNILW